MKLHLIKVIAKTYVLRIDGKLKEQKCLRFKLRLYCKLIKTGLIKPTLKETRKSAKSSQSKKLAKYTKPS